jgi:hypothetical protein
MLSPNRTSGQKPASVEKSTGIFHREQTSLLQFRQNISKREQFTLISILEKISVKMSAFPNYRSIPSIPVDVETAHKYLEAYLEATKTSPYLLPNARLEPSGPTAGSSNSGVTIYNLKRVEAGLRGEWLAPSLELEENNVPVAEGLNGLGAKEADNMDTEGWQDLEEYQREQDVIEGELGTNDTELETEVDVKPTKLDRDARRQEKKLRAKAERRKKAESQQNARSEE